AALAEQRFAWYVARFEQVEGHAVADLRVHFAGQRGVENDAGGIRILRGSWVPKIAAERRFAGLPKSLVDAGNNRPTHPPSRPLRARRALQQDSRTRLVHV